MISNPFRRDPRRTIIARLYERVATASRQPGLYLELGIPDTLEGRFEALALHMVLALRALAVSPVVGLPVALFWCAAAILLAWYLLNRSRFGLRTYAVGANPVSAGRNGIAVTRLKVTCFLLCSLSAVVAGIFLTARVGAGDATMGTPYSLDTVTAMALGGVQLAGGTGSVLGIVAGVVTLGLMSNGMNLLGVSPFLRAAVTGALLLAAIGLQRREAIGA